MSKRKSFNSNKINDNNDIKYNFDLYEDDLAVYHDDYKQFIKSEPELEQAQMMRSLRHDEIFISSSSSSSSSSCKAENLPRAVQKNKEEKVVIDNQSGYVHNILSTSAIPYTIVAPRHLRSLAEICKTYGKGRESVKKWFDEGAPIAFDGFSYFSEYHALQNWLVERGRRLKSQ